MTSHSPFHFALYFFIWLLTPNFIVYSQTPQGEFHRLNDELLSLSVDEAKVADVAHLELRRDVGTMTFTSGKFYALSPINGNTHALLYIGECRFACTPPTDVERKQLYRFYGKETFDETVNSMFLLFNDSTYSEVANQLAFVAGASDFKTKAAIKSAVRFIQNEQRTGIAMDILREFLINEKNDFFYAHIGTESEKSYFYEIDPYDDEEITLQYQAHDRAAGTPWDFREVISMFHRNGEGNRFHGISARKKPLVKIDSYVMDNTFAPDLTFSSRCSVSFQSPSRQRRWLPFSLHPDFVVDSVLFGGKKTFSCRDEASAIVWVGMTTPLPSDSDVTMQMFYHGKLMSLRGGIYFLRNSVGWYPWPVDGRQFTMFDLTFHVPANLSFVTVGSRVSVDTTDGVFTSRWIVQKPIRNASFILGNLSESTFTPDSLPPITIYQINSYFNEKESVVKELAEDMENGLKFFQRIYGKAGLDHFYVQEIPYFHGEAFPGLIHLSLATFGNSTGEGRDEIFRTHEIAHQWWGVGVDFQTYHDQWLSEAFAEYSGLWYMQLALHDNEKFFAALARFKNAIVKDRNYMFGTEQEAGPIWLGYRTQGTTTKGDYQLIVYEKGAWVLHMLRIMGLDLGTMNEDVFMNTMKDFYSSFNGKEATTEDFKQIVEKHFGMDMTWFFEQWVYGTDIPTYNIKYKLEELPNGKYGVHCTVKQANASDDFQAVVPFFIDFGEKRHAWFRHRISGPVTEFDFPPLPLKPEEIRFNELAPVLCDIESEGWE